MQQHLNLWGRNFIFELLELEQSLDLVSGLAIYSMDFSWNQGPMPPPYSRISPSR